MAKKNYENKKLQKLFLGQAILNLRVKKEKSLREFASELKMSPSNVTYIEKGVNAPTPETYEKIINILSPDESERAKLDGLYMQIRNVPPPDVCNAIIKDKNLIKYVRNTQKNNL